MDQCKEYASTEDMLDDMQLARDAGPGKAQLALSILRRDYPKLKKSGLQRELDSRPLASSVGWGLQAREGGKPKGVQTDPENPKFDVNGPRHFVWRHCITGEVITKGDELARHREQHGCDPSRFKASSRVD